VIALLLRNRPRASRGQVAGLPRGGATFEIEPPPPQTPGLRYRPTATADPTIGPGGGETSWWGDIKFSSTGTQLDRDLVVLHEKVHQLLSPKLYKLRNFRVLNRAGSYINSSLYRYFEEVLAETVAKIGVEGFKKSFVGLRFPVKNGYMYLIRSGSDPAVANWGGRGLVPEGSALLFTILNAGLSFDLWFKEGSAPDVEQDAKRRGQ